MLYELMGLMAAAPATGDNFPAKKLIAVIVIAVGILVLLSIFAVVAGKKEEEGNPGEHDPEEFNTRDDG